MQKRENSLEKQLPLRRRPVCTFNDVGGSGSGRNRSGGNKVETNNIISSFGEGASHFFLFLQRAIVSGATDPNQTKVTIKK